MLIGMGAMFLFGLMCTIESSFLSFYYMRKYKVK
jgi:hypothetical protein